MPLALSQILWLLSYIRQHYDNGNDIATAIENGEQYDFSKEMPTMTTPTPPDAKKVEDNPQLQQEHDEKVKALELRLKAQMQAFVKREEMCNENVVKKLTATSSESANCVARWLGGGMWI